VSRFFSMNRDGRICSSLSEQMKTVVHIKSTGHVKCTLHFVDMPEQKTSFGRFTHWEYNMKSVVNEYHLGTWNKFMGFRTGTISSLVPTRICNISWTTWTTISL
jgi:hypothetical protein